MKNFRNPRGIIGHLNRLLCLTLSVGMVMVGYPITNAQAQAEATASIVVEAFDPTTGRALPSLGGLQGGQQVLLRVKAFDQFGNSVPCTPVVEPIQGFTSNQIGGITRQGGDSLMTVGTGFGSAEIKASCAENPNVFTKEFVAVSTTLTPPPPPTPGQPAKTPPAEGLSPGSKAAGIVGGLALGGAIILGAESLAQPEDSTNSSGSSCPTRSQICPTGSGGACAVPNACPCPSGTLSGTCGGRSPSGYHSCSCI